MKFIHCADIHLDSKIESNLPPQKSKQRKREILLSFLQMIDYAKENGVTAVIIAGDLFDSDCVLPTTRDIVISKIRDCPDTDFLYLSGNHDGAFSLSDVPLPENLKMFSDKWTSYSYGDVTVTGVELTQENCRHIYGSLVLDHGSFNIVTMHGGLSSSSGEQLVNKTELAGRGIDYLALGHYHSFDSGVLDSRGIWCYSGCLEGRGFDEAGEKGFVLLDINEGRLDRKFIKCSQREIVVKECDITGLTSTSQITDCVLQSVSDIPDSACVKVILTGETPEDAVKDTVFIAETINSKFYFSKLVDKTHIKIDLNKYIGDVSLRGEFIRQAMALDNKEQAERIIEYGLAALSGRELPW